MSDMEEDEDYFDDDDDSGSFEDDGSDDDDAFNQAPDPTAKEAEFKCLAPEECKELASKAVKGVMELLCCDTQVAQVLLRQYKWDQDKLVEAYMTDQETVAAKAGIVPPGAADGSIVHLDGGSSVLVGGVAREPASLPSITCSICYDAKTSYSALQCGHAFCNECYSTFLTHKIDDEGHECYFARCPEPKCKLIVREAFVRSLVPDGEVLARYSKAADLARSYVDDQPLLKWCPAADCTYAVKGKAGLLSAQCACQHRFCFQCMHEDHQPASCDSLAKWLVKCRDDSETYNWLVANTKACPKCQTSIEKNGGCNHMTCRNTSCKWEFCWVCSGPWKDHSGSFYNCNKYDSNADTESPDGKKKDTSRAALERYLHYYTRFTNHHNSLKFEIDAKTKMEAKIKEMEALGDNTWMDCLYLNDANAALYECRYALQFTYVYAFYLPKDGNFRVQFEMNQTELERQTEELAEMLEKDVADIKRMEVVHSYQMALKRLRNLMELVEAERSGWQAEQRNSAGGGSSTDAAPGSSSANPMVV